MFNQSSVKETSIECNGKFFRFINCHDDLCYLSTKDINMIRLEQHSDCAVVLIGVDGVVGNGPRGSSPKAQVQKFATTNEAAMFVDKLVGASGREEFGMFQTFNGDEVYVRRSAVTMLRANSECTMLIGIKGVIVQREDMESLSDCYTVIEDLSK